MADNRSRIRVIRIEALLNDAEALARVFEDSQILDDGTVAGRLRSVLEATENFIIPGLQTGLEFSDVGFRGDQNKGGAGFRDPWETSRNQVGHFLTAVGWSFDPARLTARRVLTRSIRDWLAAPASLTDEEVALRLVVGHELAQDPGILNLGTLLGFVAGGFLAGIPGGVAGSVGGGAAGAAAGILDGFRDQFQKVTVADVVAFRDALVALGSGSIIDMTAAEPVLQPVINLIDVNSVGNSVQDLRLSLAGWKLGQDIAAGRFAAGGDIATWIRGNLM